MKKVTGVSEHEMIANQLRTYIRKNGLTETTVFQEMSERLELPVTEPRTNAQWWRRELSMNTEAPRKRKLSWQTVVKSLPPELKRQVVNDILSDCDLFGEDNGCLHEAQEMVITQRAKSDNAFLGYMITGSDRSASNAMQQAILAKDFIELKIQRLAKILH